MPSHIQGLLFMPQAVKSTSLSALNILRGSHLFFKHRQTMISVFVSSSYHDMERKFLNGTQKGLAPKLLEPKDLYGGWIMVVMEGTSRRSPERSLQVQG